MPPIADVATLECLVPNVKIFVDEPIWTGQRAALSGSLAKVRSVICLRLGATTDLCHVM